MILTGDALEQLKTLKSESVQCVVTSPPYYGLRDYGIEGQIGLEATPQEYNQRLVAVFSEVKRVLKADGTLWLNIADSYSGSGKGRYADKKTYPAGKQASHKGSTQGYLSKTITELPAKNLLGIPWRLAFALQDDGWILRQDIIWHKPSCMPESVIDRPTKAHEYIFLFSKNPQYYYDAEAIKEKCVGNDFSPPAGSAGTFLPNRRYREGNNKSWQTQEFRNKRSVWTIPASPYKGAHFATFPPELVKICISAGSKVGDTALDPFGGSGTVGAVASGMGRKYILIDINPEYTEMQKDRIGRLITG